MAAPSSTDAFALNDDGSAVNPKAFQEALKSDPEKLASVQTDAAVTAALLGDNVAAMQDLLRRIYKAERLRLERRAMRWSERTIEAQRASATVPRDTVEIYAALREAGLEYGPAFRLLRNVHVPDRNHPPGLK